VGVKLLVASYAYPPLKYPRAIQVARLVAHLPFDSSVVCASEPGVGDDTLLEAYPDGDRVVERVPWGVQSRVTAKLRNRTLKDRMLVPDRYRPWQRDAAHLIRKHNLLLPGDVLATFGQPMSDHLLGLRLKHRTGAPWIAHFSDPWTDSVFRRSGAFASVLNARLERSVVLTADALVFTSEETVDLVMAKYPFQLRAKTHVVPHAYEPALYGEAPLHDGVVVRYLGNFYGDRGPDPLFAALALLNREQPHVLENVRFELVGSREHPISGTALSELPPGLVTVAPSVPYLESLALMRGADILLVLDAPGESSVFLPSKLIDYLGSRRSIVSLTPEGAAARLTRAANGRHADPLDTRAAAQVLAEALGDAREGREQIASSSSVAEFAAPAVAERFAMVVAAVSKNELPHN
jgi:glycosyltransferase involved in cell wall biosynthesis